LGDAPEEVPLGDAPAEVLLGDAPEEVLLGDNSKSQVFFRECTLLSPKGASFGAFHIARQAAKIGVGSLFSLFEKSALTADFRVRSDCFGKLALLQKAQSDPTPISCAVPCGLASPHS
jgi:hypothetical protein